MYLKYYIHKVVTYYIIGMSNTSLVGTGRSEYDCGSFDETTVNLKDAEPKFCVS